MNYLVFSLGIFTSLCLNGMAAPEAKKVHVLAIPGQNGMGSETHYINNVLGKDHVYVTQVTTPQPPLPDFGQKKCEKHLLDAMARNPDAAIIHATSQGGGTALNANLPWSNIKALILEAPLVSGNSAVVHTISNLPPLARISALTKLPLSYYWMPYLVKAIYPFYWPAGKQGIKSIKNIPNNVPVIIIHSKNDPQLSFNDSRALYYGLRKQGNTHAYLMPQEGNDHLQILATNFDQRVRLREILVRENALPGRQSSYGTLESIQYFSESQPPIGPFQKDYDTLVAREKNHERLALATKVGACVGALAVAWRLVQKYRTALPSITIPKLALPRLIAS